MKTSTCPPRLSLDDLYGLERLLEGRLLPDGHGAVFLVGRSAADHQDVVDVRCVDFDSGAIRTVAGGLPMAMGLRPSPSGDVWAFMGLVDGKPQVCVIRPSTGEVTALTALSQGVSSPPVWSPDGEHLAFTAVGEERAPKGPYDPVRTTNVFYQHDWLGLTERKAQDIYVVSRDQAQVRRLTQGGAHRTAPAWSPSGDEILFLSTLGGECVQWTCSFETVDLQGTRRQVLVDIDDYLFSAPSWSGDGRHVVWFGKPAGCKFGTQARLMTVAAAGGGSPELRTDTLTRTRGGNVTRGILLPNATATLLGRQALSPADTQHAFCAIEIEGRSAIYRVALSGAEAAEPITPTDTGAYLLDANGQHVLCAHSDFNVPPDLWVVDHDGHGRQQLTRLNDSLLAARALPEVQPLRFNSRDGTPVQGWVMRPADSSGPCPAVLDIHGGPHAAWGHTFNTWFQALAGAGIAVVAINPRGSTGYGDEFGTAIQGCWGVPDGEDLMAGVDAAVALGVADPQRLGIAGVSGGGHLTTWLIGHSDRFKAAVPEQMITNFISFYGESDLGELVRWEFGVTPQEGFDLLWQHSPLAFAHRVTTPTLLVQCELDVRCPMGEAEQYFRALRDAGCTAEFMRIPNSYHAGPMAGPTALRRARDEAILDWFSRYVVGEGESE